MRTGWAVLLAASLAAVEPAGAEVVEGEAAPAFTKNQLDTPSFGQTTPLSLSDYAGKVVILFLLGHDCPVCLGDAPSVQDDLWEYYQATHPDDVRLVGIDLYNGTPAQLRNFKNQTGATYPLLLLGATATGGNVQTLYGERDNYVIIDQNGIVRHDTGAHYQHGNRYHPDELKSIVDGLLGTVGVGEVVANGIALRARPSPFRSEVAIELVNPAFRDVAAEVTVHDVAGRTIARLSSEVAARGVSRVRWNGRSTSGAVAGPGVYLVRATIGGTVLTKRVVRVQ